MSIQAIVTIAISVAGVFIVPGIVGLVTLVRRLDALTTAVGGLTTAVTEIHEDHKDLRKDHTTLENRVVRLEASQARQA